MNCLDKGPHLSLVWCSCELKFMNTVARTRKLHWNCFKYPVCSDFRFKWSLSFWRGLVSRKGLRVLNFRMIKTASKLPKCPDDPLLYQAKAAFQYDHTFSLKVSVWRFENFRRIIVSVGNLFADRAPVKIHRRLKDARRRVPGENLF